MASESSARGINRTTWIASMVGCAVLGSIVGNVAISFANRNDSSIFGTDSGNPTDLVIPYSGHLEVDGVPLTGTRAVRFKFHNTNTGVNAYNETHDVSFYDGKFSVSLGRGRDPAPNAERFESMMLNGDRIEFDIEVEDAPGSGAFVELSGRQSIEAAPQAVWSANAADFNAAGDLDVGGNATVTGNVYAHDLNAAQTVRAKAVNANVYLPEFANWDSLGRGGGGAAIYNDNNAYKSLLISGNFSGDGSTRKIALYEDVRVDRDLSVNRDLSVDRDITSVRDITATRDISVGATMTSQAVNTNVYRPSYAGFGTYQTGAGGAAIYNDNVTHQALVITGNRSGNPNPNSGVRRIALYDEVTVNGDLNVTGKINGLALSGEVLAQAADGTTDVVSIAVTRAEGFCFLVGDSWNPYNNNTTGLGGACYLDVGNNATDRWELRANSESKSSQTCEARCIRF